MSTSGKSAEGSVNVSAVQRWRLVALDDGGGPLSFLVITSEGYEPEVGPVLFSPEDAARLASAHRSARRSRRPPPTTTARSCTMLRRRPSTCGAFQQIRKNFTHGLSTQCPFDLTLRAHLLAVYPARPWLHRTSARSRRQSDFQIAQSDHTADIRPTGRVDEQ
jgi:hypothetical protein